MSAPVHSTAIGEPSPGPSAARGLAGPVDPDPALVGAGELLLILVHPARSIDPGSMRVPASSGSRPTFTS
jgi:hypothetical protein